MAGSEQTGRGQSLSTELWWEHGDWHVGTDDIGEVQPIIRDIGLRNSSGERWWGSVATIDQIQERLDHYEISGECAGGAYFWAAGLVVVRDDSDNTLMKTVNDLIDTGGYEVALVRILDNGT